MADEPKTKVVLGDGWDLWITNYGPGSQVMLSFTESAGGPIRERITVYMSQAKAVQVARALANLTFIPPIDDEPTQPG